MRISLNWIKRLLGVADFGLPVEELQQLLTLRVAEVEHEVERVGPELSGVVVGKVLTCAPHPNADRLRLTTVDVGGPKPLPIVCGAPNVAAGQLVAVATVGTTLRGKDGKPLTIKPAKLRGEPSQGMICAEDELGLGDSHDGILVLAGDHLPGTPLAEALGVASDVVLTVDNHGISHRPDLWGHWGWAREIAAVLGFEPPPAPAIEWPTLGGWSVELRDPGCLTYAGAVVEGVANRESPRWMRDLLTAVGVRPLGLLVDITNIVMLEVGEPMHAFDRREIAGSRIVVRGAAADETMRTLDGREQRLAAADLLIADERRPLALAGIMGGEGSMVQGDTSAIVLEAAVFRAERIRRTRIRAGMATDSSARFEKSLAPEIAAAGMARALALVAETCPEARVVARFHAGATAGPAMTSPFTPRRYAEVVGQVIPGDTAMALLAKLGFTLAGHDSFAVPWWRRKDIAVEEDLVEEVARLRGLDAIPSEVPRLPAEAPVPNPLREAEHRARRALAALGWDEVATYGFTSDEWARRLVWDERRVIRLANPLAADQSVLRASLVPTLAEAVGRNRKHLPAVALYEVGKRYAVGAGAGETPDEELLVAGMCAGQGDEAPFYAARDAALAALRALGYDPSYRAGGDDGRELQPARAVELVVAGEPCGVAGELTSALREAAGCPERVGWFRIDLEKLVARVGQPRPMAFVAPSRFPPVEREFTWVCPEPLPYGELEHHTRRAAGPLFAGAELITVYRGDPIPAGQKATSLRVRLQAGDRTLEERELAQVQQAIVAAVEAGTPARLRA